MSKHFKGLSFPKTQGIPREVEGICFLQHFWISQKDIRMNGEGSVHILKALVLGDVYLNQWLCLLWVRLWQKHLENQAPPPPPELYIMLVLRNLACIRKAWKPKEEKQSFWQKSNFALPVLTMSPNNTRMLKQVSVASWFQSDFFQTDPRDLELFNCTFQVSGADFLWLFI